MWTKVVSVAIIVIVTTWSSVLGASDFASIVVFGDSLSDDGNLFAAIGWPPEPYWQGRFSNGPIWTDGLAERLDLDASALDDRAIGGASTAVMSAFQVDVYIDEGLGVVSSDALYVIWGGANDLLALLDEPEPDIDATIANAVLRHAEMVSNLHAAGARDFLVPGPPDLSRTPRVLALGSPSIEAMQQAVVAFDAELSVALAELEDSLDIDILRVDAAAFMAEILGDPVGHGFTNWTEPAIDPIELVILDDPSGYLFWDDIHPTTLAHSQWLDAVIASISARRGDANHDGSVDLGDAQHVLDYLFGPPPGMIACADAADIDDDGVINIGDAILLLDYLFQGGAAPAPPGPFEPGIDPTADSLRCG